jgi:hypothetical protein
MTCWWIASIPRRQGVDVDLTDDLAEVHDPLESDARPGPFVNLPQAWGRGSRCQVASSVHRSPLNVMIDSPMGVRPRDGRSGRDGACLAGLPPQGFEEEHP